MPSLEVYIASQLTNQVLLVSQTVTSCSSISKANIPGIWLRVVEMQVVFFGRIWLLRWRAATELAKKQGSEVVWNRMVDCLNIALHLWAIQWQRPSGLPILRSCCSKRCLRQLKWLSLKGFNSMHVKSRAVHWHTSASMLHSLNVTLSGQFNWISSANVIHGTGI